MRKTKFALIGSTRILKWFNYAAWLYIFLPLITGREVHDYKKFLWNGLIVATVLGLVFLGLDLLYDYIVKPKKENAQ